MTEAVPLSDREVQVLRESMWLADVGHPPTMAKTMAALLATIDKDRQEIARLTAELRKEECDHERTIEERDRAQDALQNAHLALGGDGEWVARLPNTPVPDSGDLHEDVPVLAACVREMRDEATEELASLREKLTRAREALAFYANPEIYHDFDEYEVTPAERDSGRKASHALLSTAEKEGDGE